MLTRTLCPVVVAATMMAPHVSHFEGTRRVIEHIERHVCPTITSDQLLGGEPFRFAADIGASRP